MYLVPDLLELQFPGMSRGYFSAKGFSPTDKLNILSNWICHEIIINRRSWASLRAELGLEENSLLEIYFRDVTGYTPEDFTSVLGARFKNSGKKDSAC
ncbi:MAG: hypothetical protein JXR86_05115 [Spirochaetales bacterium]|nr:hypothetical protein [Spirochaetales bacterium]